VSESAWRRLAALHRTVPILSAELPDVEEGAEADAALLFWRCCEIAIDEARWRAYVREMHGDPDAPEPRGLLDGS
jgi:hypothetical protein